MTASEAINIVGINVVLLLLLAAGESSRANPLKVILIRRSGIWMILFAMNYISKMALCHHLLLFG